MPPKPSGKHTAAVRSHMRRIGPLSPSSRVKVYIPKLDAKALNALAKSPAKLAKYTDRREQEAFEAFALIRAEYDLQSSQQATLSPRQTTMPEFNETRPCQGSRTQSPVHRYPKPGSKAVAVEPVPIDNRSHSKRLIEAQEDEAVGLLAAQPASRRSAPGPSGTSKRSPTSKNRTKARRNDQAPWSASPKGPKKSGSGHRASEKIRIGSPF